VSALSDTGAGPRPEGREGEIDAGLSLVLATSDQRTARRLGRDSRVWVGWNAGDERVVRG
jgi:hypothetical protein